MNYAAYTAALETLARRHKQIAHDASIPDSGEQRMSFFRANDEGETQLGDAIRIHFPCMVVGLPAGRLQRSARIEDIQSGSFEIRLRIEDINDYDAQDAAREIAKAIALQIVAQIDLETQEGGFAGFEGFDVDGVRWEFTGPVNDNQYGCRVFFTSTDEAYDAFTYKTENYFN